MDIFESQIPDQPAGTPQPISPDQQFTLLLFSVMGEEEKPWTGQAKASS